MAVTYASLVADIPVRLMAQNRAWPAEAPNTIRKGQERLLLSLHPDALHDDINGQLAYTQIDDDTIDVSQEIDLTATANFGEIDSLWLTQGRNRRILVPRAYDYCVALFAAGAEGVPRYYAERKPGLYEIFPKPAIAYFWAGIANLKAAPLGDSQQTNLLTDRFPTLLEYSCCIEGALWMKDKAATDLWLAAFTDLITITNDNVRRRRGDATAPVPPKPRASENAGGAP